MKKYIQTVILSASILMLFSGCEKFIEEKSDNTLSIPTTIKDFQAMLNSYGNLNVDFIAAGEVSSDDYYLDDNEFSNLYYESDKRLYTWQPDYVTRPLSSAGDEWYNCYKPIYICNSVLQGLDDNNLSGDQADNLRGQALVFRAVRYLDGIQIWAPAYNKLTANNDLGMVLRTDPDINVVLGRSSMQETYDLIIRDLTEAIAYLPINQSSATIPTKATAYSLLSRTYLFMGEYEKALQNAEQALENTNAQLIDFNTLDPNNDFPIPTINNVSQETMLWSVLFYIDHLDQSMAKINPTLYNLYENGDLRKSIYFGENDEGSHFFKGSFLGTSGFTNTPTPAELLLTIAECNVRLGNLTKAENALNKLLVTRWKSGEYSPLSFSDNETALQTVLTERRKELVMRGLRWPDIKRLNRDGANIELTRIVNGRVLTLPPNDLRYAIAIPETVIEVGGLKQNPR
ncbi:RagB/SusD family nutrient uptake outer membrane protein [Sphingobacterium sp.]|uniref:RagB/SusD family nutrient uptake outer membrane protein n=1 Tax=Sphingobacterium sp. TaxID=341027 RepID=UPI00289A418D|nr:RagB/SusD family nutrient uptake outer membrane protein [Sphingobacterium sp.]